MDIPLRTGTHIHVLTKNSLKNGKFYSVTNDGDVIISEEDRGGSARKKKTLIPAKEITEIYWYGQ